MNEDDFYAADDRSEWANNRAQSVMKEIVEQSPPELQEERHATAERVLGLFAKVVAEEMSAQEAANMAADMETML